MPEMVVKSLDESRAYIRGKLEGEKADVLAGELMAQFEEGLQSESLLAGDEGASIAEGKREDVLSLVDSVKILAANEERLSKDIGLVLWKGMYADEPADGNNYQIKHADGKLFATMRVENSGIFSSGKKADDVFRSAPAVDNPQLYITQIIDSFTDQSYKDFEKVKPEVILNLAAEKAYPELLKQAEALKAAASKADKPGLSAFFEAKEHAKWAAQLEQKTYAPLDQVSGPESGDGIAGESQPAIALTLNGGAWYLKAAGNDGDMKRVTIGRVIETEKDFGEDKEIDYTKYTSQLNWTVSNLNMRAFNTGLAKRLEE